jgi:hypothetical protein
MDDKQTTAVKTIMKILLDIEEGSDRAQVFAKIRCNSIFCPNCGIGSIEDPNECCPCLNDE